MQNKSGRSDLYSIKIVFDLKQYIEKTGDYDGLEKRFKVSKEKIENVITLGYDLESVYQFFNDLIFYNQTIKERKEKKKREELRLKRIDQLTQSRENFCGIGTNKIKRRLNKLVKNGNKLASAFRLALEAEDCSIRAKSSFGKYVDRIYEQKHIAINQLISLCLRNEFKLGKQPSDVFETQFIIYFELPGCEQISFHTDINSPEMVPDYENRWDTKENSVLPKLEKAILFDFPEIVER